MNKKGLQFKNALFALIVVSMSIIAIGFWIDEWNTSYDSGLTYDLQDYNKLEEGSAIASEYQGNISARTSFNVGEQGNWEGTALRGAFTVVNSIFDSFDAVFGKGGMLNSIENRWGLPNYIISGILALMILATVFALVALLFRKSGGQA